MACPIMYYSWLPITRTLTYSNYMNSQFPLDFLHCNFTLDIKLKLCFQHGTSCKKKTVYWSQNIGYISKTTVSIIIICHSSSISVSIQGCILIKFCCLIPLSKCQSLSQLIALEVKCAQYLHSLPIHLLISLFPVICFKLPITRTFFLSPRWFKLWGVDWSLITNYLQMYRTKIYLPLISRYACDNLE